LVDLEETLGKVGNQSLVGEIHYGEEGLDVGDESVVGVELEPDLRALLIDVEDGTEQEILFVKYLATDEVAEKNFAFFRLAPGTQGNAEIEAPKGVCGVDRIDTDKLDHCLLLVHPGLFDFENSWLVGLSLESGDVLDFEQALNVRSEEIDQ
jgi:hypothetical protein